MTMKDGFNLKALFPKDGGKHLPWYPVARDAGDAIILCVFTVFFCVAGLVGNGNIIWLLGFHIKRKAFAIYVLNLAVADFGTLVFLLPLGIYINTFYFYEYLEFHVVLRRLLLSLFISIYSSRQVLLAAMSVDRWVSAVFPNWYQCHRSSVLSTTVCAFIWALTCGLGGVSLILSSVGLIDYGYEILEGHIVSNIICLFLVILSTLTLLGKVCFKSQPCQCGILSKVTLLLLLSSLLFTILTYTSFIVFPQAEVAYYGLWTSLKSSINPLIYFLARRWSGGQFQERMMVILQRVFKEERDAGMERPPHTQTSKL